MTQKDLAKLCGVSTATVSLALSDKPSRISEQTKQHVRAMADRYGYRPNTAAQALATGRTNRIGVLVPDLRNSFFSMLANEICVQTQKMGFTTLMGRTGDTPDQEKQLLQDLVGQGVDGLIILRAANYNDAYEIWLKALLEDFNKPVVALDRSIAAANISNFATNHQQGGYDATNHLIRLGHQRIGCLTGPLHLANTHERVAGYRQALSDHGIAFDPTLLYEGNYEQDSGSLAFHYFERKQVSAVFACNDLMAYGLIKTARSERLALPQDLSIVGFDDIYVNELLDVPLTSVAQPLEEMARDATVHLISQIEAGDLEPIQRTYQPQLRIRQSSYPYLGA